MNDLNTEMRNLENLCQQLIPTLFVSFVFITYFRTLTSR